MKEVSTAKFDETVEAHFRLGIDTRQADQQLRAAPSACRTARVSRSVLLSSPKGAASRVREAGADIVGTEELIAQVQAGELQLRRRRRHPGPDGQGWSSG